MAFLTRKIAEGRRSKTFTIKLEDGTELLAQRMCANDEAAYFKAFQQNDVPVLRLVLLAGFVLRDPDTKDKPLFDLEKEEDMQELGRWPVEDLHAIAEQYHAHFNPAKNSDQMDEHAKTSETAIESGTSISSES